MGSNKKTRVSFVMHPCPAILDETGKVYGPVRTNQFPQSQIVLASQLDPERYEPTLLDLRTIDNPAAWREELSQPYATPINYGQKRLSRHLVGNIEERIRDSPKADVYALSANFTYEANAVKEAIAALKKHNPEAMIVVGGSDASPRERHEFYFRAGADHIGIGDAEKSLPKFLEKISSGKVERDKGRLIPGEGKVSVIDLEIVARMRYDTRRFTESGGGPVLDSVARKGFVAYLEMQRGCNRTCDFCSAAETPFDHLSVEEVKRQMDNFDSQGAGLVMFTDDNLLMRRSEELREIFQYMQEKKMAWEFPNGLEFGLLNIGNSNRRRDNLVEALFWNNGDRDNYAGAHRVLIPVEDSLLRQSSLLKLRHGGQAEVLEEVIQRGVPYINLGIMIGSATETKQERKRLEGWLDRFSQFQKGPSQVNYSLFCTMPLPGTQLGRDLEAHGKIRYDINKDPELWNVFTSVIEGDNFSPEETTAYRGGLLERYGMNQRDGKVGSA